MKRVMTIVLMLTGLLAVNAADYRLYMTLGLSAPAGTCSITESSDVYKGASVTRVRMTMQTTGIAGAFYSLNDTITSYIDGSGASVFYSKAVHEGAKNVLETAEFSQDRNSVKLTIHKYGEKPYSNSVSSLGQIYDMLSLMKFAEEQGARLLENNRQNSASDKNPVEVFSVPMVNGNQVVQQHIHYIGTKSVADASGKRHSCVAFSIRDFKNGPERETMRIYITDDSRHIPVRLDIVLGQSYIKALREL